MMRASIVWHAYFLTAFATTASALSCSASDPSSKGRTSESGSGGGIASGVGGSPGSVGGAGPGPGSGGNGIITVDASISDASVSSDATCAASTTEGHLVPLDLFIMLDQSSSMDEKVGTGMETRWSAVTKAIGDFVQRPEASGLGVGINYFGPTNSTCVTGKMCATDAECGPGCGHCVLTSDVPFKYCEGPSCDAVYYARAETPIAPLPGNAQAILASLARHRPSTATPSSAALQGAVTFTKQWAIDHPGRAVVVVFATDGGPSQCDTDPANIEQMAATAFNDLPSIRTFVIGVGSAVIPGSMGGMAGKALLDGIARSGGTMQAFMVSDADVTRQFVDALQAIRGSALQCAYTIPDAMGKMLDFDKVNVRYTPGGGVGSIIPKVPNAAGCAMGEGWYYDDDRMPTRILMCPATCDKFTKGMGGKVEIEVGCSTIIAPPR
jgi:hypothetical protein